MYVFRPQHTPGCSAGHHRVNRSTCNACKIQRRPKDRPRCQLPLQARRKLELRNEPGNAGAAGAAATGSPETYGAKHENPSHAGNSDGKRNAVRDRLRSRLVQRRTTELVTALQSRHGDAWTSHVRPGGFHAVEAMGRICEGFGLRPDLERQVLKTVLEYACTWAKGASEALSQHTDTENCNSLMCGGDDDDDDAQSNWKHFGLLGAGWPAQQVQPRSADLESSDASCPDSDALSPAMSSATSPTCSPSSNELSPCLCSSDGTEENENDDDAESLGWTLEELPPPGALKQQEAACSRDASRAASRTWRAPWRRRVLSTLGIDRWWSMPSIGALSTPELVGLTEVQQTMLEEAGITEEVEEESAEDMALSSKLVTAVLNAERQATSNSGAGDDGSLRCKPEPSKGRQQNLRPRGVQFGESSTICFFAPWPDHCLSLDGYHRRLETKVFDGPSGHKAKRATDEDSDDADSSASQEKEWEDRCDDIAELMSRERHMLWSDSW
eukprot:TRINITY_DN88415_c0_g1_i1.p1 TRINITY_DN88415_c0_g1~~TRINITY_DN88415_c0_g1_i1.p1  ORF type:complete len:499 (+),score=94.53 TRINITY_DN88415_c0_g1_i1:207-1703(+)